jgi:hypothetical protein
VVPRVEDTITVGKPLHWQIFWDQQPRNKLIVDKYENYVGIGKLLQVTDGKEVVVPQHPVGTFNITTLSQN